MARDTKRAGPASWAPVGPTLGSTAIVGGAVVRPGWGLAPGAQPPGVSLDPKSYPAPTPGLLNLPSTALHLHQIGRAHV